ncbi:MAG: sigma-54 interaction domain-containing protein [Pyrinomonadaceae bacterium]
MELSRSTKTSQHTKTPRIIALQSLDLSKPSSSTIIDKIIGESTPMKTLKSVIMNAARCRSTALITGESGTGKELAARTIHDLSERASKPFVTVNCGALTESLLEAELFGSVRGSFTGATSTKQGLFVAAHTGTIFLDEFGEMSPAMQVRLLRVLQERKVRPIGAHDEKGEINVDVRIIAATNKDLEREVKDGRFRHDLYFRVNVQQVHMPPLRAHRADIPALVRHLLIKVHNNAGLPSPAKIEPAAVRLLATHNWPGNVRELENKLEYLSALGGTDGTITLKQVRSTLAAPFITINANGDVEYRTVWRADESIDDHFARQLFELYSQVRDLMNGNHARTARKFGVKRSTLHMRIENVKQRFAKAL